ncbi:MAG: hypothetical protein AAGA85_19040 [Bacteroidota bacterium]
MLDELKILFDQDQEDCAHPPADGTPEHEAFRGRIKERMAKAQEVLRNEESVSGEDYFHACILFIHGDRPEDFWQAYQWGLKSVDLGYTTAKKYTAAAYDRWLMYQGKPQKYGLQYVPDGVRLRVWDVDPTTSDEERAAWDVPPLQQLYAIAEDASKHYDLSKIDMDKKPQWLKDAIKRWDEEGDRNEDT